MQHFHENNMFQVHIGSNDIGNEFSRGLNESVLYALEIIRKKGTVSEIMTQDIDCFSALKLNSKQFYNLEHGATAVAKLYLK